MKFNQNQGHSLSPRAELERKYATSRANLILVTIVSIVNLFTLAFNSSYFLFSASLPSLFMEMTLSAAYEAEIEVEISMLVMPIVFGLVMTLPYLLCGIFSKKHVGWMIAALVFFSLDCIYLLMFYEITSVILDILFHAWVMFYLITGVMNGSKLRNMPADEPADPLAEGMTVNESTPEATPTDDGFATFNDDAFNYTESATAEDETAEAETEKVEDTDGSAE